MAEDLLLYHSMAELDYLDGWARLTWMQYGSISRSLWLSGEMRALIEDSKAYWYDRCGASPPPPPFLS